MPFPDVPRVIYKKNPLVKVICQIKFPPILKIDAEIPAQFQEKIRIDFPNYSDKQEPRFELSPELRGKLSVDNLTNILALPKRKNHEFSSEDNNWIVNLTSTFIAFSCEKYHKWEDFITRFSNVFEIFVNLYSPSSILRIGLRYIDVIKRSALNLVDTKWSDLLRPQILGLFGSSDVEDRIDAFDCKYEVILSDGKSKVRIITGFVDHIEDNERCFMVDSDFFNEEKNKIEEVQNKLLYFNQRASRLIQWCITEKLHNAMEPAKYE
jgi:uncharacterized protein (TIGR04255 family)